MCSRPCLRVFVGLLIAVLAASFALGCSKKTTTAPPDPGPANARVTQANAALEQLLFNLITSPTDPTRPSDLDFRGPYNEYKLAIQEGATSLDAPFGAAVLGLLTLSSDTEVNAAFDEWSTYLQTRVPFGRSASPLRPLGVPLTFAEGRDALDLPFQLLPLSVAALANPLGAGDPQINRIQDILEQRALPKLTEAHQFLAMVAADPNYVFTVTPRMQGDLNVDPVEIDRTDVLALRAACLLLASATRVAVAYDLGFATLDSAGMHQALQPGSGWLALRSTGQQNMMLAGTGILEAMTDLEAAIQSLLAETDSQDDDVIKIGPSDIARRDIDSLLVYLPIARSTMQTGYTLTEDWDGNPGTPPVPLMIAPGALFNTPVQDWKALLPSYTPSVTRRPLDLQFVWGQDSPFVMVDIPAPGFYNYSYEFHLWAVGDTTVLEFGDSTVFHATAVASLMSKLADASQDPFWTNEFHGSVSFNGTLGAGMQSVTTYRYWSYTRASAHVAVPVITWTATQFADWTWPDPDMGGVLPGITTSDQLKSTFGMTAANWEQTIILDYTGSGISPNPMSAMKR